MGSRVVLLACTANVCRSPLAELLMRAGLDQGLRIQVESVGTHAREGDRVCSLVAGHDPDGAWARMASAHRASAASPELLDSAELILTASREIRSEIVRLNPAVRDRTFTFREAAHRGSEFNPRTLTRRGGAISSYATHLDQARWSVAPVPARNRWFGRSRHDDDPISIADGHGAGVRAHRNALKGVADAVEQIIEQINRFPSAQNL